MLSYDVVTGLTLGFRLPQVRYRGGFNGAGSSEMFTALFALVVNHGFTVPPQIAAAFRALGALEGTLRLIDPSIDVVLLARDEGRKIATAQFGPKVFLCCHETLP